MQIRSLDDGVEFVHTVAEQQAIGRSFVALYALVGLGVLGWSAVVAPEYLVLALAANVALTAWSAWVLRRTGRDWSLALTGDTVRFAASDGGGWMVPRATTISWSLGPVGARFRRSGGQSSHWLTFTTGDGTYRVAVPLGVCEFVETALEELGWAEARA